MKRQQLPVRQHMEMARISEIQASYMSVREQGAPQYVQGQTIEEQGHSVVTTVREENVVAGQVQEQYVEIPTEEVQVSFENIFVSQNLESFTSRNPAAAVVRRRQLSCGRLLDAPASCRQLRVGCRQRSECWRQMREGWWQEV